MRDYQEDKVDIIHKYNADEARNLKAFGELPETGMYIIRIFWANERGMGVMYSFLLVLKFFSPPFPPPLLPSFLLLQHTAKINETAIDLTMEGGSDSEDEIGVDFDEVQFISVFLSLLVLSISGSLFPPSFVCDCGGWGWANRNAGLQNLFTKTCLLLFTHSNRTDLSDRNPESQRLERRRRQQQQQQQSDAAAAPVGGAKREEGREKSTSNSTPKDTWWREKERRRKGRRLFSRRDFATVTKQNEEERRGRREEEG